MKNQDIDFFPDDICRPYYGSVPRWYSQKNDFTVGKRAEHRHLGLPVSVCHQGLFCIILGVTQDQRNAANCML